MPAAAPLGQIAIFALIALAARMATFGNPVQEVDEQFYLVVAKAMAEGQLLYVDIWDRKPIGLFLLYLPSALLTPGLSVLSFQLTACAFVIATALVIRRIVQEAGWRNGANFAAIFYILWINFAEGQGGQSPVFYNLVMAGAALCVIRAISAPLFIRPAMAAMALAGLAIQIKYTVIFEGAAFGLILCHAHWRTYGQPRPLIRFALLLMGIALLPTIAVGLAYLWLGYFPEFFYANFLSIFDRSGAPSGVAENALILALILTPGLFLALWGRSARQSETEAQRRIIRFLYIWLGVALSGVIALGTYFDHYGLPVMVPAACCAARSMAINRKATIAFLALLALAGQAILHMQRTAIGTGSQLAHVVRTIGSGPGHLHVFSGPTALYSQTGRKPLTSRVFPAHLKQISEADAVGLGQHSELARILAKRPEWIVTKAAQADESRSIRNRLEIFLAAHYRPVGTYKLGRYRLSLFRVLHPAVRPARVCRMR